MEKVIVFGRGTYYKKKVNGLKSKYIIIGFLDNAVNEGTMDQEQGVPVYNPADLDQLPGDIAIILMSFQWFEMYDQLREKGVNIGRIILGITQQPVYGRDEELLQKRGVIMTATERGVELKEKGISYFVKTKEDYRKFLRKIFNEEDAFIQAVAGMKLSPSSIRHGVERGTIIDRVYIERFLLEHQNDIHGTVMEIGNDKYTRAYGKNVNQSIVIHVDGRGKNTIKANFVTREGLIENSVDCLICTQTLTEIYDIHNAVKNIFWMLKPNGVALFTCGGAGGGPISLTDYHNWGEYWKFTDQTMQRLLEESFQHNKIETISYGNLKTLTAFLYGMCAEEIPMEEFDYYDERYPVIVAAAARK